jgi:hypothetical protein
MAEAAERLGKAMGRSATMQYVRVASVKEAEFDPTPFIDYPIKKALHKVKSLGLDRVKKANNVVNLLPSASLTVHDLRREPEHLVYRAIAVAHELGVHKAVARITTNLSLKLKGVENLHEWWLQANPEQRLRLLSDARGINESSITGTGSLAEAMELVPCPFRGSDEELAFLATSSEETVYTVSEDEAQE